MASCKYDLSQLRAAKKLAKSKGSYKYIGFGNFFNLTVDVEAAIDRKKQEDDSSLSTGKDSQAEENANSANADNTSPSSAEESESDEETSSPFP